MNQRFAHSANLLLWLGWVVASTASVVIAWYGSYAAVDVLERIVGAVNEDHLIMPILVAIIAVAQAVSQALLLRHHLPHATRWIAATIMGWIIACSNLMIAALSGNMLRETVLRADTALYVVTVVWGVWIGGAQWLVLRRHSSLAGWWIPANVVGWSAVPLLIGPALNSVIEMAILGAVPAVITGLVLVWLLRQPPDEAGLLPKRAV